MAKFYNLIILDKSGSMTAIRQATIGGVNETLGTIRAAKKENGAEQFVTILPFCGCAMKYTVKNAPIDNVRALTAKDYEPCCMTPLLDAIGKGLTDLKKQIGGDQDAVASVTIITDGYENASHEWTYGAIKSLIESLKAEGWLFAFIGANIDVEKVGDNLGIENRMAFNANEEETEAMFEKERSARKRWYGKFAEAGAPMCAAERRKANKDYFDK